MVYLYSYKTFIFRSDIIPDQWQCRKLYLTWGLIFELSWLKSLAFPTWHNALYLTYPGRPWSRLLWILSAIRSSPDVPSANNWSRSCWNKYRFYGCYFMLHSKASNLHKKHILDPNNEERWVQLTSGTTLLSTSCADCWDIPLNISSIMPGLLKKSPSEKAAVRLKLFSLPTFAIVLK